MDFLRLGIAPLVSIKDRQVIEHRSHVGMIGAELFLVNFQRVQIIWLSCLLAAGLAANVRLARSRDVSATRIASGKRLLARRLSSLSLRIDQSFSSPFIPHHQPSLNWVINCVARSSVASGNACRSSVTTSAPTKKLVLPMARPEFTNAVPLRAMRLYFTCMVSTNSVVANTFPRTERAGERLI